MKRFFLILMVCCIATSVDAAKKTEPAAPEKFSMKEVQAGVMSFADSWSGMTTQATNYLAKKHQHPGSQLTCKSVSVLFKGGCL